MADHKPFLLASRYNVVAPLQSGGMATVFKARDLTTDQSVAIKRFDRGRHIPEIIAEAYTREVEALKCLTHPNILRILDSGDDDQGNPYLVLELMEHDLLAEKDHNGPAFGGWDSFSELIVLPLLDALIYAHEQGVAHRDVKPANILLSSNGTPKLADFGVSKLKRNLQPRITLQGFSSPPFSPPDVDKGDYTYARDVFSIAAVCVWGLAGSAVTEFDELAKAIATLDVPHQSIRDCLSKAVHEDPSQRFENAVLFANELRSIGRKRAIARQKRSRVVCSLAVPQSAANRAQHEFQGVANPRDAIRQDLAGETHIQRFLDKQTQEPVAEQYRLIGSEKIYHIAKDTHGNACFVVRNVTSHTARTLRSLRESAPLCPLDFRVGAVAGTQGWAEASRAVEAAFAEYDLLRQEQAAADADVFSLWDRVLEAQLQFEKNKAPTLSLKSAAPRGRHLVVSAKGQDLSCVEELQRWRIDNGEERFIPAIVIEVRADEVVFDVGGSLRAVPTEGRLLYDIHAQRVALDRQRSALDRVRSRATAHPSLRDVISDPATARCPVEQPITGLLSRGEMEPIAQRIAASALGEHDVVLVEGPPGTGKTSFIVELILQELHRKPNARVLVSSQTHIAIDNALERLAEKRGEHKLLRIANEHATGVNASAMPFLLDNQLREWREQVFIQAGKGLDTWARSRGINPVDARVGSLIRRLRNTYVRLANEQVNRETRVDELRMLEGRRANAKALGDTVEDSALQQGVAECKTAIRFIDQEIKAQEKEQKNLCKEIKGLRADAASLIELPPNELDEWADVYFGDHGVEHDAEAILSIQAEWLSRFSSYEGLVRPLAERSSVIFATCIGLSQALGDSREVVDCEFDLCIIDEASKATATECLVPLVTAKRSVLVGDSRQLSPFEGGLFRDHELCERYGIQSHEAKESLFERYRRLLPASNMFQLETQYRMVEPIGSLVSECFYEGKLKSKRQSSYKPLLSLTGKAVNWFTTERETDRHEQRNGTSYINTLEISIIERLLLKLDEACAPQRMDKRCSVMVLSGYAGQVALCDNRLRHLARRLVSLDLQVCTIDRVQGREADVVLFSVTRSNRDSELGFLSNNARINVALSRARDLLCIIGDAPFVRGGRDDVGLKRVLDYVNDHTASCCIDAPPL